ncbi:hypothetical protein [Cellvibrio sp. UBA7661]|uniref:hypothetical protein n=1 Tax=Cellvibrio sp. UBA7661 TaxID=1946311 RepID=UPI002F357AE0
MKTQQRLWLRTIMIGTVVIATFYFLTKPEQKIAPVKVEPSSIKNENAISITQVSNTSPHHMSSEKIGSESINQPDVNTELKKRLTTMHARRPNQHFNSEDVAAAAKRTTTWTATDTIHRELPLAEEEFNDGRQFIELDSLKIETLMPGDQVNMRVDEKSNEYKVTIDRIEKHDYNSISWYGHIEGNDGQRYQVSFTRGEHLTVGGMDTPDGHFVIQAHGNKGWIASSQLLFKQDTSVTDAIHPADVDPNYQNQHSDHTH